MNANGIADNHDREATVSEQTFGDALNIIQRDGVDQLRAPLDIVPAQIIELDRDQHARDLGVGVETQRKRSVEEGFGALQFHPQ